jgi:hypothetical protein
MRRDLANASPAAALVEGDRTVMVSDHIKYRPKMPRHGLLRGDREKRTSDSLTPSLGQNEQPGDDAQLFAWSIQLLCSKGNRCRRTSSVKGHLTEDHSLLLSNPPRVRIRRSNETAKVVRQVAGIAIEFMDCMGYLLTGAQIRFDSLPNEHATALHAGPWSAPIGSVLPGISLEAVCSHTRCLLSTHGAGTRILRTVQRP